MTADEQSSARLATDPVALFDRLGNGGQQRVQLVRRAPVHRTADFVPHTVFQAAVELVRLMDPALDADDDCVAVNFLGDALGRLGSRRSVTARPQGPRHP
jgi:hypothetical protein